MIGEKTVREIAMVVADNCGCEKIMENKVEKFLCYDYDTILRVYQTLEICLPLQYEISMEFKERENPSRTMENTRQQRTCTQSRLI